MGSMLDKPKTEWVDPEKGSSNGLAFGASSIQGWRTEMEVSILDVLASFLYERPIKSVRPKTLACMTLLAFAAAVLSTRFKPFKPVYYYMLKFLFAGVFRSRNLLSCIRRTSIP